MRRTAALFVLALTIVPLYYTCWVPWRCNIWGKRLTGAVGKKDPLAHAFLVDNVSRTEAFRRLVPNDAGLNIALASTYNQLGRFEDAIRIYDEAFEYDKRPEMYFNRGGIRLRLGDREGAYEDFLTAALFNTGLVGYIGDPAMKARILAELKRLYGERRIEWIYPDGRIQPPKSE